MAMANRKKRQWFRYAMVTSVLAGACVFGMSTPSHAQFNVNSFKDFKGFEEDAKPQAIEKLQNIPRERLPVETIKDDDYSNMPFDIREEAMIEAAISYGARGGLAWRTYAIRKQLDRRASYLDRVFDFGQLLIPAPSGFLIEPPIVSEQVRAMLIKGDGQEAAVTDRVYNIVMNARMVTAPRVWRNYLERTWDEVEPPPDVLRPVDDEERAIWSEKVEEGWREGIRQAEEIFAEDLNLLIADFEGMIRYRSLLAQGMVSPPYALQVDRGITGDGDEMRIGDRAVQLTGVPELITGSRQWNPANQ